MYVPNYKVHIRLSQEVATPKATACQNCPEGMQNHLAANQPVHHGGLAGIGHAHHRHLQQLLVLDWHMRCFCRLRGVPCQSSRHKFPSWASEGGAVVVRVVNLCLGKVLNGLVQWQSMTRLTVYSQHSCFAEDTCFCTLVCLVCLICTTNLGDLTPSLRLHWYFACNV